jgi:hypothetical protein
MKSNEEKEDNKKTNVFRDPANDFVGIFIAHNIFKISIFSRVK